MIRNTSEKEQSAPMKKKSYTNVGGHSALMAYQSINQGGYTFNPIKKYEENHVFFGVKEEVKKVEPAPEKIIEVKPVEEEQPSK